MESASENRPIADSNAVAFDALFLGGGLSCCVAAYYYRLRNPSARIAIVEKDSRLGGNHTWCFHSSDLEFEDFVWLQPLLSRSWSGYQVCFPTYERRFRSAYHAIESSHLNKVILAKLGDGVFLGANVEAVEDQRVRLSDGRILKSSLIIDGRGWPESKRPLGFQKFLGQRLALKQAHGLEEPILMDATCTQIDGYRFFYVLPWGPKELLVEDTRYSDTAGVEAETYRAEIQHYCTSKGWTVENVLYEEQGALPLPLSAKRSPQQKTSVLCCGLRGELFHATTGYSLPSAVAFARWLVDAKANNTIESFFDWTKQFQKKQAFFRTLNRLLFRVALPQQRWRMLDHFYRLPEPLVQRFYRGNMSAGDKVRFFLGRPPVSVSGALQSLWKGEHFARI